MYCKMCGKQIEDDSGLCPECGAAFGENGEQYTDNAVSKENATAEDVFALISLVASATGLITPIAFAIIGLVFGIMGRKSEKYGGFAKAGIIISIVSFILKIICVAAIIAVFFVWVDSCGQSGTFTVPFFIG